jgi:hypothetical protein
LAKDGSSVKVKFILTPLSDGLDEKLVSFLNMTPLKALLPECNFNIKKIVGFTHSSIQIGRKVLHWFNTSIVFVKNFEASDSLMVLDMGVLDLNEKEHLQKLDKVQDIIIKWNVTKKYNRSDCSCQEFCSEILDTLEYSPKQFKGQLSKNMTNNRNLF